jgi:hypothetical protein
MLYHYTILYLSERLLPFTGYWLMVTGYCYCYCFTVTGYWLLTVTVIR